MDTTNLASLQEYLQENLTKNRRSDKIKIAELQKKVAALNHLDDQEDSSI